MTENGRGQVYTLEAFTAAVVILASLAFALGMVGGPAGADGPREATEEAELAEAVLSEAHADGSLRRMLLYWNEPVDAFHGAGPDGYYDASSPPTDFGDALTEAYENRSVVFEVNLVYVEGGDVVRRPLVERGDPGSGARRVSRTVTLYDRDVLYDPGGNPTNQTLENSSFWTTDASPGPVYAVVEVEVVVWQI